MALAAGSHVNPNVRLVRPLGQGGMGFVWIAQHLTLDTQVAVKLIPAERWRDDAISRARFIREAKAAAKIKSPHVVQVFDHGVTQDGTPFIVMELLHGESLDERLKRAGAMPLDEVVELVRQVARALGEAHQHGIVHRDIKPGNIFLLAEQDGVFAKVLDFGIAKELEQLQRQQLDGQAHGVGVQAVARADLVSPSFDSVSSLTSTGALVGTPLYMSPEQLLSTRDVDFRSDIWSLAVVAYHALTSRPPFLGQTLTALFDEITHGRFQPASTVLPGLPVSVDQWFTRTLRVLPEERYASAREAASQLAAAAQRSHPSSGPGASSQPSYPPAASWSGSEHSGHSSMSVSPHAATQWSQPPAQTGPTLPTDVASAPPVATAPSVVAPQQTTFEPQTREASAPTKVASRAGWIAAVVALLAVVGIGGIALGRLSSTRSKRAAQKTEERDEARKARRAARAAKDRDDGADREDAPPPSPTPSVGADAAPLPKPAAAPPTAGPTAAADAVSSKCTQLCADHGRCHFDGQQCVARSEAACKAAASCRRFGQCGLSGDRCAPLVEAHCLGSTNCKAVGRCSLVAGRCKAASDADCQRSMGCKTGGRCTAKAGGCFSK